MGDDRPIMHCDPLLPSFGETVAYIAGLGKPSVHDLLRRADRSGELLIQPRCGVGSHQEMANLLTQLEAEAQPDILSLTIDAYTRLRQFDRAAKALREAPRSLNGYPLVCHGYQKVRELNERVRAPIEIRHGSPDARLLFEVSIGGGVTSFEGGGIGYNLPYAKDVTIGESLRAWRCIDRRCGEFAARGIIVDRELFGTLTAVLIPPSVALATTLLEALCAAGEGVRCISIAVCQGGHVAQDIAALRAIRRMAARFLPKDIEVFPVLHQFMGAFPLLRRDADALILRGAVVAAKGRATKVISKTYEEAHGVPTPAANVQGIWTTRIATSRIADLVPIDEGEVEEEAYWILREVEEIVSPILAGADIYRAIEDGLCRGLVDVPFSASRHACSRVVPMRDATGAIRYHDVGGLALGEATRRRNARFLCSATKAPTFDLYRKLTQDILYFADPIEPDAIAPSSASPHRIRSLEGGSR